MNTAPLATALKCLRHEADGRSDRQLLEAYAAANDQDAFATLVKRHGPLVLGVCRRVLQDSHDAEDAFQAVFLVLARKAAGLRNGEALTSWLHGVAYRVALRANRDAARRRKHEGRVTPRANPPAWEVGWRELQAVLDEEVERLPPVYRAAFVLCCLEGLSLAEAAERLGIKANTVSSQLARARTRLRERLGRRGISLATVLAVLAVAGVGRAAVPPGLVRVTAAAASRLGTGTPVAGLSAKVLALAEGVTATLRPYQGKLATVVLLALCTLVAGLEVLSRPAADAPPVLPPAQKPDPRPARAHGNAIDVGGRVLDPNGKPVNGARVYVVHSPELERPSPARASSDAAGRFRFRVPRREFDGSLMLGAPEDHATVVAVAGGYGIGLPRKQGLSDNLTLRLVKDVPLAGRVLDLQGRPVPGVTVRVRALYAAADGDLSTFLAGVWEGKELSPSLYKHLVGFQDARAGRGPDALLGPVVTGTDGRFALKGVGRERLVHLSIEGPTIAAQDFYAMTRPGDTLRVPDSRRYLSDTDIRTLYGNGFGHVAVPSRAIVGVVRDKDTGKPLPGAVVTSYRRAGSTIIAVTDLRAVADKDGRFRLDGMPKGAGNLIRAGPPEGAPYLMSVREVADTPGLAPLRVDFVLKRGVRLSGRVLDQVTRRPVHGYVRYVVFADNPHLSEAPDLGVAEYSPTNLRDGTFHTVALPGRGVVAARAWKGGRYRTGVGADRIKGLRPDGHFETEPYLHFALGYHTNVEVNPAADVRQVTCDILLDPGTTLEGTVHGPDGKPLAGATAAGLQSDPGSYRESRPLADAAFTLFGLEPGRPRLLQFAHTGKKLAGHLVLKGDEKGPVKVQLVAAATLTGRLVTADGQPTAAGTLSNFGGTTNGTLPSRIRPGKDGTFRIEGLAPGLTYRLGLSKGIYLHRLGGMAAADLKLAVGETRNLGDVVVRPIE